jgi:uncharacterized protein (DUF2384 family)/anti-sigma regulatory factor (Ser/Thr protein kinase)
MERMTNAQLEWKLVVAADALRQAEERAIVGMHALEMMHEIRSPIEALECLTYVALEEADHPEKVRTYMRLAEEQMATINQIASQTLGLARPSHAPKATDLGFLAEAALRIHQRTIESKSIHLVKDFPEDRVAEVYTGELLQVISNLIVNALDAMPINGTLCLRLRKGRSGVRFVVADSGHGIPAEHADAVFQPFFTTKEGRGTGLGLAISKKIVERHHGRLSMRSSVRPGKSGTIFAISLPTKAEPPPSLRAGSGVANAVHTPDMPVVNNGDFVASTSGPDEMMTVKELILFASRVLGSVEKARAWMDTPHARFGGSPAALLGSEEGRLKVTATLKVMENNRPRLIPDSKAAWSGKRKPLT